MAAKLSKLPWPNIVGDSSCVHWDTTEKTLCKEDATNQVTLKTDALEVVITLCGKHFSEHNTKNAARRFNTRKKNPTV